MDDRWMHAANACLSVCISVCISVCVCVCVCVYSTVVLAADSNAVLNASWGVD